MLSINLFSTPFIPQSWGNLKTGGVLPDPGQSPFAPLHSPVSKPPLYVGRCPVGALTVSCIINVNIYLRSMTESGDVQAKS
jgi:hypothetical protein